MFCFLNIPGWHKHEESFKELVDSVLQPTQQLRSYGVLALLRYCQYGSNPQLLVYKASGYAIKASSYFTGYYWVIIEEEIIICNS